MPSISGLRFIPSIVKLATKYSCYSNLVTLMLLGICGGLNRKGSYRLMSWNAWRTGSGTIRMFVLVGVCVAFLEEVCH